MAQWCIPKHVMANMAKSIKGLADSGQIQKLVDMSSADRLEFFKKTLNTEDAVKFNDALEKAVSSKRLRALGDWIKKNLDEKYRKDEITALGKDFKNLDEVNAFIEQKTRSLADKKLGLALTAEETQKFTEIGKRMYEEGIKLGSDFIDLSTKEGYEKALPFGKAHKEMVEYTKSLMPVSAWRSFLNRIGRATMLASIKTPFLNIESNSINAITTAISRRLERWQFTSSVEKGLASDFVKNSRNFFKETGIDMSRMISFEDTVAGAGRMVGENVSDGKFLKGYTDFIFNTTLSKPDVAFGSFAFADSASLNASRISKNDSKRATDIFKDSTLLNPKTDEGKAVRLIAIADARLATYTNDSVSAKFLESTRELMNKVPGFGDVTLPFVKTPANVAELGADYAGLGFVKAGVKGGKILYTTLVKGGEVDRVAFQEAISSTVRAGLGMTTAFAIASQLDATDFMGSYDPRRVKIDQLSNTSYNAIKVKTPFGEKWISVDYFGPLGASVVGYMYAKKYGDARATGYVTGVGSQYLSALGLSDVISGISDTLGKIDPDNKADMFKIFGDDLKRSISDVIVSRMVPGIMYDLARATDDVQRDTRQKKYVLETPLMDINFDQLANKIPYWRENLPVKFDALGRTMYEESAIDSLMFGARVRTSRMDYIVDEIYRLRDNGQQPTVKDLRFMYSTKVDELKEKTGDKFYEVARKYGESMAVEYENTMNKEIYKKLSDEEKKKALDKIGQDLYEKTLKQNGVKYR